jgi:NADPH:quinone reductase-like Zn-dependent oxidoreductase
MIPAPVTPLDGALALIRELLETGKVTPVIDRVYSGLAEVREALRYLEEGRARGKVVVRLVSTGALQGPSTLT